MLYVCVFVPLHVGVLSILTYLPVLIVFRDATLRIAFFILESVLIVKYKYNRSRKRDIKNNNNKGDEGSSSIVIRKVKETLIPISRRFQETFIYETKKFF